MGLIQELKNLQTEALSLDEQMELSARAKVLTAEYQSYGIPVPAVVTEGQRTLAVSIKEQARASLMKELKDAEAAETQLMTAEQKREMLASRKAEIAARLAALGA